MSSYHTASVLCQAHLHRNTASGMQSSEAYDINNNGIIVGSGRDEKGRYRGFLYRSGTYKTLIPPGWEEARARAVNDGGDVAGQGLPVTIRAFSTVTAYTPKYCPRLEEAYAYGISNNGEIVGYGRNRNTLKAFFTAEELLRYYTPRLA